MAFADFLDGDAPPDELDPERAELIRVQCELARLGWSCPAEETETAVIDDAPTVWTRTCGSCDHCRLTPDLAAAQSRLLTPANNRRWWPWGDGKPGNYGARRGFAVEPSGPLAVLLEGLPRLGTELRLVERVEVTDKVPGLSYPFWTRGWRDYQFGNRSRADLPSEIWFRLEGGYRSDEWVDRYGREDADDAVAVRLARDDLSAAILSLCRGEPAPAR